MQPLGDSAGQFNRDLGRLIEDRASKPIKNKLFFKVDLKNGYYSVGSKRDASSFLSVIQFVLAAQAKASREGGSPEEISENFRELMNRYQQKAKERPLWKKVFYALSHWRINQAAKAILAPPQPTPQGRSSLSTQIAPDLLPPRLSQDPLLLPNEDARDQDIEEGKANRFDEGKETVDEPDEEGDQPASKDTSDRMTSASTSSSIEDVVSTADARDQDIEEGKGKEKVDEPDEESDQPSSKDTLDRMTSASTSSSIEDVAGIEDATDQDIEQGKAHRSNKGKGKEKVDEEVADLSADRSNQVTGAFIEPFTNGERHIPSPRENNFQVRPNSQEPFQEGELTEAALKQSNQTLSQAILSPFRLSIEFLEKMADAREVMIPSLNFNNAEFGIFIGHLEKALQRIPLTCITLSDTAFADFQQKSPLEQDAILVTLQALLETIAPFPTVLNLPNLPSEALARLHNLAAFDLLIEKSFLHPDHPVLKEAKEKGLNTKGHDFTEHSIDEIYQLGLLLPEQEPIKCFIRYAAYLRDLPFEIRGAKMEAALLALQGIDLLKFPIELPNELQAAPLFKKVTQPDLLALFIVQVLRSPAPEEEPAERIAKVSEALQQLDFQMEGDNLPLAHERLAENLIQGLSTPELKAFLTEQLEKRENLLDGEEKLSDTLLVAFMKKAFEQQDPSKKELIAEFFLQRFYLGQFPRSKSSLVMGRDDPELEEDSELGEREEVKMLGRALHLLFKEDEAKTPGNKAFLTSALQRLRENEAYSNLIQIKSFILGKLDSKFLEVLPTKEASPSEAPPQGWMPYIASWFGW
ncbi:MAG: hypothetical protein K0S07_1266 [Chlamydiales bacterium]|jgi:hypothetical protein|nr:hypothetical protein [Chlamydiales bacterium]